MDSCKRVKEVRMFRDPLPRLIVEINKAISEVFPIDRIFSDGYRRANVNIYSRLQT